MVTFPMWQAGHKITLPEILALIPGAGLSWRIFDIEGITKPGHEIAYLSHGRGVSGVIPWAELLQVADAFDDLNNCLIATATDPALLAAPHDEAAAYDLVIEGFDSSSWEFTGTNAALLTELKTRPVS